MARTANHKPTRRGHTVFFCARREGLRGTFRQSYAAGRTETDSTADDQCHRWLGSSQGP